MGSVGREHEATGESHLKVLEKMGQYAVDAALLMGELRIEVARKLEELRERKRIEVEREVEHDAPRQKMAQGIKRKSQKLVDTTQAPAGDRVYWRR